MDLVVGASGLVGKQIALDLRHGGRSVRALLRGGKAHVLATDLVNEGIEVIDGDVTRPQTLKSACEKVETVLCTVTSMPHGGDNGLERVDRHGVLALIEAAERANVRRFIYISYTGNIREDSPLQTAKRECEKRLLASTMAVVILRPSFFMESWLSPAVGFDPLNGSVRIYGSGEARVNYVSATDVAKFAVAVTSKNESGKIVLEIGGPEPLSQKDAAHIFETKLLKTVVLDFVSLDSLEQQHYSPDPLQKTFAALMIAYTKGDVILESESNAAKYGIRLHRVTDYAAEVCDRPQ